MAHSVKQLQHSNKMAFKFVVFACVLAVARAGVISGPAYSHGYAAAPLAYTQQAVAHGPALSYAAAPALSYAAPVAKYAAPALAYSHAAPALSYAAPIAKAVVVEPSAPAQYNFEYAVQDPHTGDFKSQKEVREGDAVHGSYSLIEADGSKRTVEYTADAHNGFNAVVHREPAQHPVAVKAVAPVAVKAIHAAPALSYAAPAIGYAHAAPAYYHH